MMDGHHRGPSPPSPVTPAVTARHHQHARNDRESEMFGNFRTSPKYLRRSVLLSFCPSVLAYSHCCAIIYLHPSPRHILQTGASEFAFIFWRQECLLDCHTYVLDIQVKISK
jgi:hypothetical protein